MRSSHFNTHPRPGTFLGVTVDSTQVPALTYPPVHVGRPMDYNINIGTVANAPAGNLAHPSWLVALSSTLVAASASLANVGGLSISLAAGETIGLWFIWMDGTRSIRSVDAVVPGVAGVYSGGSADPTTNLVSDAHLRLSYAMQARTWMNANWNNTRPWTGAVRYTVDPPPGAPPAACPAAAASGGGGGAVAAAVIGWLLAAALGGLLVRARAAGSGGRRGGDAEGVGLVDR